MKPPKWLHLVHIGVGTAIRGGCDGFDAQGLGQGIAHLRRSQRHWGLGAITIHHQPSPSITNNCWDMLGYVWNILGLFRF